MTAQIALGASVNVDGKQASAELQKLTGNIAATKVELLDAKNKAQALSTEFRKLNRDTEEGAARANQLKEAMRGAQAQMFEASRAAAAAEAAYNKLGRSAGTIGNSAGQARASMANLGQQIGDVSQGIALGTPLATIYAQQSGQVAYAASGMGGTIGKVASFLSGPWGAAITGATVVLGALWATHERATEKADKLKVAEDGLGKPIRDVATATELLNKVQLNDKTGDLVGDAQKLAKARTEQADATYRAARAEVDAAIAMAKSRVADVADGAIRTNGRGGQRVLSTQGGRAGSELYRETRQAQIDLAAAMKEGAALDTAFNNSTKRFKQQADAADAAKDATKNHNKELREAERAATAAARAQEAFAEALGKGLVAIRNSSPLDGSKIIAEAEAARRAALDTTPRNDLLGSFTAGKSIARIDNEAAKAKEAADAFNEKILVHAVAIGEAIGGSAARSIGTGAGLARAARTGDFTGVGGPIGGLLNLAKGSKFGGAVNAGIGQSIFGAEGQGEVAKLLKPLKPMGDAIGKVFGDGGKVFGKLIGGAATGSAVAGLANAVGIKLNETGAKIGGAIGQLFGPLGSLVGSVLGGIVGNLFGKPKGSTTVSATDGKITTSSTGDKAIQKATGQVGNSVTDALQAIADQLGASIGSFAVSIGQEGKNFRVDTTGKGSTKKNNSTVLGFGEDSGAALAAAIADALKDGAIKTSPRVQAALTAYGDNVNKAVADALKVKGLEDLLGDRKNPFASAFRNLENQLKQRVDVASKYGFDLVEIERVNGEDRAKALKDTLANATGSVRNLLNDLQFGSRATGSATQRLAGLTSERDRLTGLVRNGDTSQLDAVASVVQQIIDLQKETFGTTGAAVTGRADNISLLNDLVSQTDERIKAAADAAKTATGTTNDKLTELNASADDQVRLQNAIFGELAGIKQMLGSLTIGPSIVPNFTRMS
jgi:hypothetical protein